LAENPSGALTSIVSALQRWREQFAALAPRQQIAIIGGLALSMAFLVALLVWWQNPVYHSLYTDLPEEEAGQVIEFLQQQNISYKIDDQTGRILVPEEDVHTARMRLASAGIPKSGGVGFELLDKPQGFGVSQFMEDTRYQRALKVNWPEAFNRLKVSKRRVFTWLSPKNLCLFTIPGNHRLLLWSRFIQAGYYHKIKLRLSVT